MNVETVRNLCSLVSSSETESIDEVLIDYVLCGSSQGMCLALPSSYCALDPDYVSFLQLHPTALSI